MNWTPHNEIYLMSVQLPALTRRILSGNKCRGQQARSRLPLFFFPICVCLFPRSSVLYTRVKDYAEDYVCSQVT